MAFGRIVLVTSGSFGDVNPFVGLALALQARGHHPVIVSAPIWREWVQGAGIEFETFEEGWDIVCTSEDLAQCLNPAFLRTRVAESYRKLAEVVRSDDLLVSLTMVGLGPIVAASLVAEAKRIPWVAVVLEPLSFFSAHELLILPPLGGQPPIPSTGTATVGSPLWCWQQVFRPMHLAVEGLRAQIGLPPGKRPCLDDFHGANLVLALFSELLAHPQPDWPSQTHLAGFVFHDGYGRRPWPRVLEQFLNAGPPPIVFTFSSDALLTPDPDFASKCIFAARALASRAVIVGLTLPGDAEAVIPEAHQDVCFVRSVSFAALFRRGSAVVHHGGIGTTALALQASKPMLVIPSDYAQPDIAARVTRMGVARTLPRVSFTGPSAAAGLLPLLTCPSYRIAAERAAAFLAHEDGARAACTAIADLVHG